MPSELQTVYDIVETARCLKWYYQRVAPDAYATVAPLFNISQPTLAACAGRVAELREVE